MVLWMTVIESESINNIIYTNLKLKRHTNPFCTHVNLPTHYASVLMVQ